MLMFRGLRISASLTALLVVVLVINQPEMWKAKGYSYESCEASSCGHIHNISYPFRLDSDPPSCGHKSFELRCENNVTLVLYFNSIKFNVRAIDYDQYTIGLVDPGVVVSKDNCYFPPYILSRANFTTSSSPYSYEFSDSLMLIRCQNRVNSEMYVDYTPCINKKSATPTHSYWYVIVDGVDAGDMTVGCSTGQQGMTSWMRLDQRHNLSLADIHAALVDGFVLTWYKVLCGNCPGQECYPQDGGKPTCYSGSPIPCDKFLYTTYKAYSFTPLFIILKFLGYYRHEPDFYSSVTQQNSCGMRVILESLSLWLLYIISTIIALNIVLRIVCCIPFMLTISIYKWRRRHLSMFDDVEHYLKSQNNLMPIRYSYSQIKKMTRGFKDKLGEGGYGCVYKGKLRSGSFVAIKILGKTKANGQEFINEVATIGRIHHINVVKLIGYCAERSKRAFFYDFMPNRSLEKFIFSREDGIVSLTYKKLYEISIGVARGIEYLHRGCDIQILHFDIKPHNILLDESFTPKVSDFGLAKLYPTDDSIVSLTAARGTMGYMAPELFYKNIGGVSYKADIYSFGMLLLEMAGRRKNLNVFVDHTSQIYYPSWIHNQISEGNDIEMGDATEEERDMAKKMIIVALWCIQMKPVDRPSMHKVVEMLEGHIRLLQMPPKPNLCPEEMSAAGSSHGANLELSIHKSIDSITLDITNA